MANQLPTAGNTPAQFRARKYLAITAFVVFVIDDATKLLASHFLGANPHHIIGSFLQLHLTFNTGAAFSLGSNWGPVLGITSLGISGLIIFYGSKVLKRGIATSLGLILGGALGNVSDRLLRSPNPLHPNALPSGGFFHGAVVDWIELPHWPIFNIADSCVSIGIIWLVFIAINSEI